MAHSSNSPVTAEMASKAIDVLRETLNATKKVRATGRVYEEVPDHAKRIAAAELILAYQFGRPASKSLNVSANLSRDDRPRSMTQSEIIQKLIRDGAPGIDDLLKQLRRKDRLSVSVSVDDDEAIDL